jgi:hypothetical protein
MGQFRLREMGRYCGISTRFVHNPRVQSNADRAVVIGGCVPGGGTRIVVKAHRAAPPPKLDHPQPWFCQKQLNEPKIRKSDCRR